MMRGSLFTGSGKRLARLLSLMLVILMFCSLVPVGALAADDTEPPTEESTAFDEAGAASDPALAEPVQEEPALVEEPAPVPEEPAAEEPEAPAAPEEDPEDDLPPDAGETPVGDNIVPLEEGEVPEAEEPEEEAAAESAESAAESYSPPLHFEARSNGVTVIVDAPEGTLPYGTGMRVAPVRDQAVLQTIGDELGADASRVTAVDISFLHEEAEIEPDGFIFVTLKAQVIESAGDAQVVHMDNYGATQVVEQYANYAADEVSFVADSFSVYAIVDGATGGDARLKITFLNGETELVSMYLKKADVTADQVETIIYDPGEPVEEGKLFAGWTTEANYDSTTTPLTIDEVRQLAVDRVNADVTEGGADAELKIYAMMRSVFHLFFEDEQGVVFNTVAVDAAGDPLTGTTTVNTPYSVSDATQGFIGWVVKGTTGPVYKNGDPITLTKDTTLVPKLGPGHWLYFDENDGGTGTGGASYTPPAFIPSGETCEDYEPENPTRPGYTFGGWYTAAEGGTAFYFTQNLDSLADGASQKVYAHWTPKANASYKVIIWAQSVNDDKDAADSAKTYDYVKTIDGLSAPTDTQVTDGMLAAYTNYGNTDFGVTDLAHGSTAFRYSRWEVENGSGADNNWISASGETVVNVYYDRNLFTINYVSETEIEGSTRYTNWPIYKTATSDAQSGLFGNVNGEYVSLVGNSSTYYVWHKYNTGGKQYTGDVYKYQSRRYVLVGTTETITNPSGDYYFKDDYYYSDLFPVQKTRWTYTANGEPYQGNRYTRTTGTRYVKILTGLYGQGFSQYNYTWMTPSITEYWNNAAYLDAFTGNLFGDNKLGSVANTITVDSKSVYNMTLVFWVQNAENGDLYTKADEAIYACNSSNGFNVTDRIQGMKAAGYMWSTDASMPATWKSAEKMTSSTDGLDDKGFTNVKRENNTYLHVKYDRVTNDIVFMNGSDTVKTIPDVPYGKSLAGYAIQVPTNPEVDEGYYFAGWYQDPEGKIPADWSGTMPMSNKVLYAVTKPVEYHVIVDLKGGALPAGSTQDTEFWVPYLTQLDDTEFNKATYTADNHHSLVGYYLDEGYTRPWNFDTKLTNDSMTILYDGPNDEARANNGGQSDVGWPNVVGVLKLYARWRDDSILASGGLHIVYEYEDKTGATQSFEDPNGYADLAKVIAKMGPPQAQWPEGKIFDCWVLPDKTTCYPTNEFEADSAVAVDIDGVLTITLTARYKDAEEETPTHIDWYSNTRDTDGTALTVSSFTKPDAAEETASGWVIKNQNLRINDAVDIPPAATYEYPDLVFLGWAKSASANGTDDSMFLKWDGSKYLAKDKTGAWVAVTQVAADEKQPYDSLYAVWQAKYTVKVQKLVTGNMGDVNRSFTITVTADRAMRYNGKTVPANTATELTLKNGQTPAEFTDVIKGTKFTLTETAVDGYETSYCFVPEDSSLEPTLFGETAPSKFPVNTSGTFVVTNTKDVIPDTGITLDSLPFVLIAAMTVLAGGAMLLEHRRRRNER